MKYKFFMHLPVWVIVCAILSCSKQKDAPGFASLTLINAVPGSDPSLVTNFGEPGPITWYKNALKLVYGKSDRSNQALAYSGEQQLVVYRYPDTSTHSTPLYNLTLDLQPGFIHTLFLTGTLATPDTLFTTDELPYYPASDSAMGIRFVNLSPGSNPVSVNITGLTNGSEVSSLPYKAITGFKKYPATAAVSTYKFEFRDATSGTLLGSYEVKDINAPIYNSRRYRNFTMAFMGLPDAPATRKILLIDTYTLN